MAPVGTPADVVRKLSEEVGALLKDAEVVARFRDLGCDPSTPGPESLMRGYEADIRLLGEAARLANYQPQ